MDYDYNELNRQLDITKSEVFRRPDAAFFGPLMCSLDFQWTEDPKIPTAGTDGKTLWWNIKDFLRCREEKLGEDVSTLMHELHHAGRLHDIRRGERCPDVWNIACDIRINRDLRQSKYYIGTDWVDRPQFDNIDLEEDIYDKLPKMGGGGSGGGIPGAGKCSHIHMTPAPSAAQISSVVQAIQAAKMSGQPGSIPGNVESTIEKFLRPVVPWERLLNKWMRDLKEEDYSWRRPNRRYPEMYMPGKFVDEGRLQHLLYFQDVSGSIGDRESLRFNSELKYVWDYYKPRRMTIAQFDTRITKIDEFTEGDIYEKIKIVGRGGTSLVPVRQLIIDMQPTAAIIFSDMCVEPMQKLPKPIPILWVGVNAYGHKPPFGKYIDIKA